MKSLDVDAVQAFVTIAELRSFTRAADLLGSTQGALSVKLKRLENRLGERLLERTPRQVRLSVGGERFLPRARDFLIAHEQALAALSDQPSRRFTLGIAIHLFGPEVPTLLARLKALDPHLTLEVSVDDAPALLSGYDRGEFDAVIIRSDDDRRQGEVLGPEHFGWYAAADFTPRPGEPLRLASYLTRCAVRDPANRLLDAAGIPWTSVFVGGTSAVAAALAAGLAVAAFPRRLATANLVDVGPALGLPAIPSQAIELHSSLTDPHTRATLRAITAAFGEHRRQGG